MEEVRIGGIRLAYAWKWLGIIVLVSLLIGVIFFFPLWHNWPRYYLYGGYGLLYYNGYGFIKSHLYNRGIPLNFCVDKNSKIKSNTILIKKIREVQMMKLCFVSPYFYLLRINQEMYVAFEFSMLRTKGIKEKLESQKQSKKILSRFKDVIEGNRHILKDNCKNMYLINVVFILVLGLLFIGIPIYVREFFLR